MPLLNQIFHESYGNKKNNLKATANRGWYPANWKLVEHPSLLDDMSTLPDSSSDHPPTPPTICTSLVYMQSSPCNVLIKAIYPNRRLYLRRRSPSRLRWKNTSII